MKPHTTHKQNIQTLIGTTLTIIASASFIIYGIIFATINHTETSLEAGITHQHVPLTREDIRNYNHQLDNYINHLHISIASLMIAFGILMIHTNITTTRHKNKTAWITSIIALLTTTTISIPAHIPLGLASLTHLLPPTLSTLTHLTGNLLTYTHTFKKTHQTQQ